MPHVTKIPRKPEGVGAEIKALASGGEMGVIIGLDLMEGQEHQRQKPFWDEFGEGTAVCLRLMTPYFRRGHILHADSAFSSVKTLCALASRGVRFMGIVKTAHRQFPVRFLRLWAITATWGPYLVGIS
jgi:hypothetical protein